MLELNDRLIRRLLEEDEVNFCYCDESGTGQEPIATMVGILVDSGRMHLTKIHWEELLETLSGIAGKKIAELHTADFYRGNGVWRSIKAETRVSVVDAILGWLAERKHHVIYTSVTKNSFCEAVRQNVIPDEINTPYRFIAFHLILAVQKYSQPEKKNKGHTVLVFDNEERERVRLSDAVLHPRDWSNEYYDFKLKKGSKPLDQIIDAPYFADSKEVYLLQLADFLAFFLRRYAEIEQDLVAAKYDGEKERIAGWIQQMSARCIGTAQLYPKKQRNKAEELFYCHAPKCIREL
jgi:hypothetical protein